MKKDKTTLALAIVLLLIGLVPQVLALVFLAMGKVTHHIWFYDWSFWCVIGCFPGTAMTFLARLSKQIVENK